MTQLIPNLNFESVIMDPWRYDAEGVMWIIIMGFLVNAACGTIGTFLVLRRMALIGDAISHAVLPGIVIAFILTSSIAILPMLIGAVIAGICAVVLIEMIHKNSRIKPDAAMGIVFSAMFAIGVILLSLFADKVHLDLDCVLYGEIGFVSLSEPLQIAGLNLGPRPVIQMAIVFLLLVACVIIFYKELLVSSFDSGLAKSLGIPVHVYHYGLLVLLSITVVSAFEAVGAILVIAMLIFPSVTANLITHRLPYIFILNTLFAIIYAIVGYHLAVWLNSSIAPCMVIIECLLFTIIWWFNLCKNTR